jgi:2-polyprenyl-6-methoxyphenol hydroxylase-like FAD-dependent oxidoreductase
LLRAQLCAQVSRLAEHAPDGGVTSRALATPLPIISRPALVAALLSKLEERILSLRAEGKMPLVSLRFDTRVVGVELDAQVVRIATADSPSGRTGLAYDLLIGADGADSVVRTALLSRPGVNYKQEWISGCAKVVQVPSAEVAAVDDQSVHIFPRYSGAAAAAAVAATSSTPALVGNDATPDASGAEASAPAEAVLTVSSRAPLAAVSAALHAPRATVRALRASADVVASTTPVHAGTIITVSWSADAPPDDLLRLKSGEDVTRWMRTHFPLVSPLFTPSAAAEFAAARPRLTRAVSLNQYHDPATRAVVLLGDAAHASAPSAGQGAAAALSDAALLARLLATHSDARDAAAAFSAAAVPDGHAVVQLASSFPALQPLSFPPWLRLLDRGREAACEALAGAVRAPPEPGAWSAPVCSRSVMSLLFASEEPYAAVLKRHRVFLAGVMLANGFRDGATF